MLTAIIDYESGNLHSAEKAFQRMAAEVGGGRVVVTDKADLVARADRVVLPGDGAFPACAAALRGRSGLFDALRETVETRGRPFLGICVGMQLMSARGLEKTTTNGLGWIAGDVVEMKPADASLKIPQIGWNTIELTKDHPLFDGISTGPDGLHAYFVHSYHLGVERAEDLLATTDYGGPVTAAVARDNMVGTQFHPEKSQKLGLALIGNFLRWQP